MMPVKQIIVVLAMTLLVYNTSPVIGQSPEDNYYTRINYFNSGQYSTALPYFQSCVTTLPTGSSLLEQAHFYLIKSYVKLEDETKTLTELDNLRTRNPQSPAWARITTWCWITFLFTPVHQDWFQIRNLQLGYIVKGTASPDSQVWVDQVKLEVIRFDDP